MATNTQTPNTQAMTVAQNKANILAIIKTTQFESQLEAALMNRVPKEFFLRIATSSLNRTRHLAECAPVTVAASLLQIAQAGLAPEEWKGHAYLIPRKNNRNGGRYECSALIGYRGYVHLANQSPKVALANAFPVYDGDVFEIELGSGKPPVHKPWTKPEGDRQKRGDFIGAYAVVKLKNGEYLVEWMTKEDIDTIRKRSQAGNDGPWVTDYVEMARKTPFRRIFKWLPDDNLQKLAAMEEATELGRAVPTIDASTGEISYEFVEEDREPEQQAQAAYTNKAEDLKARIAQQKTIEGEPPKTEQPKAETQKPAQAEAPKTAEAPKANGKKLVPEEDPTVVETDRGIVLLGTIRKVFAPKDGQTRFTTCVGRDRNNEVKFGSFDTKVYEVLSKMEGKVGQFLLVRKGQFLNLVAIEKLDGVTFDQDGLPVIQRNADVQQQPAAKSKAEEPPFDGGVPDPTDKDLQQVGGALFPEEEEQDVRGYDKNF